MKNINFIILLFVTSLMLSSCYEETHWVDENTTGNGKHLPVIQSFKAVGSTSAVIGQEVNFVMTYFSVDDVANTSLNIASSDTTEVQSLGYSASNYIDSLGSDQVVLNYTIPESVSNSPIVFFGKVTTNEGSERTKGTVKVDLCHQEIKDNYSSYVTYTASEYEYDEEGNLVDTDQYKDTITSTVMFTKIDDNTYTVDDGSFGFINDANDPNDPKFPIDISRDNCNFSGSKTYELEDGGEKVTILFSNNGIAMFNKELRFDWTIEVVQDGLISSKFNGTSLLTPQ